MPCRPPPPVYTAAGCHDPCLGRVRQYPRYDPTANAPRVLRAARQGDARQPLLSWAKTVENADWHTTADIRAIYRSANFMGGDRVIFNIGGNKVRLIVRVSFTRSTVWVRFVGTHADHDRINPEEA